MRIIKDTVFITLGLMLTIQVASADQKLLAWQQVDLKAVKSYKRNPANIKGFNYTESVDALKKQLSNKVLDIVKINKIIIKLKKQIKPIETEKRNALSKVIRTINLLEIRIKPYKELSAKDKIANKKAITIPLKQLVQSLSEI